MPEGPALIIALFIAGFVLLAAEVLVPGLVLGIAGLLCLAGSVALVFVQYGTGPGLIALVTVGGLTIAGFVIWLSIFPRTFIGRRVVLSTSQPTDPRAGDNRQLVGEEGTAATPLRPAGAARIAGRRVDVTTAGEFLEEGVEIVVVAADGMRVVVRRKDGLAPAAESV